MSKININLKLFLVLLPVLFLFNCNKDNQSDYYNIPYVSVYLTINLELPSYADLQDIGGYVVIGNYGYRGIIVYHSGLDEYVAIERTCTYQPLDECSYVSVDNSGTFLKCGHYNATDWVSCCDSKYTMDGYSVITGPAKYSLKHYQVTLTGTTLRITN